MLGIVTAFREETRDYLKQGGFRLVERNGRFKFYRSEAESGVALVQGGVGRWQAVEATRQLVEGYAPTLIVSAGFAGGVQKGLSAGDVFVCERVMSVKGPAALWRAGAANERLLEAAHLADMRDSHEGYSPPGCLSVPQLVPSSSMKAWIGRKFPVSVIDMESYWVSETAASFGIRHAVVRAVLDPVEQTLPTFVGDAVSSRGGPAWVHALKYASAKPWETPKLFKLASQAKRAGKSLAAFLETQTWNGL